MTDNHSSRTAAGVALVRVIELRMLDGEPAAVIAMPALLFPLSLLP